MIFTPFVPPPHPTMKGQQVPGPEKSGILSVTMEDSSNGGGSPGESAGPQGSWRSWLQGALTFFSGCFRGGYQTLGNQDRATTATP